MKKKPVILYVCNTDWFFLSHRSEIAAAAIDEGYEVHFAAPIVHEADRLRELGICIHSVNMSRSGANLIGELSTLLRLWRVMRRVRPDIVHAITPKPTLYMSVLTRLQRTPHFVAAVSGLGHAFTGATGIVGSVRKLLVSTAYRVLFRHPRITVIFQNSHDRKILEQLCPSVGENSILLNGSGVDLNAYQYEPENPEKALRIVMASRLLWAKGVREFVEAAKTLKQEYPEVIFELYGKIDDHPSAIPESLLQEWNEQGDITWRGHSSNVAMVFSECCMVVLPSYYGEGMPKVLLEAAASGKPVVTTSTPGCMDAVENQSTGLVIPARDIAALTDAIRTLLHDPALRMQMGKDARELACSRFSVDLIVEKHLSLYARNF